MLKKRNIAILIVVFLSFTAIPLDHAHGGCSGGCNAIDPNDPNISSNGERIFLTGMSKENGKMVPVQFSLALPDEFFAGGADHKKKIESGNMPCTRCHNFYGTGGVPFEHEGRTVKSADLVNIGGMKFSLNELQKAVADGVGMDKRKLVPFMPRFRFTENQLKDVKTFIESLPERLDALKAQRERKKGSKAL